MTLEIGCKCNRESCAGPLSVVRTHCNDCHHEVFPPLS